MLYLGGDGIYLTEEMEYWYKSYSNNFGLFGDLGVVPNNLVYVYDFVANSWTKFTQLNDVFINKYSCTTFIQKEGTRFYKAKAQLSFL